MSRVEAAVRLPCHMARVVIAMIAWASLSLANAGLADQTPTDEKPKQFEGNLPKKITPDKEGALVLPASKCAVYGTTLQYMPEDRALGYWNSNDDHADWMIEVARPGKYEVWYEWSCHDDSSGNTYLLTVGKSQLKGIVPTTKVWTNHMRQKFGTIELLQGESKLTIKAVGDIKDALFDLREVKLVPTEK